VDIHFWPLANISTQPISIHQCVRTVMLSYNIALIGRLWRLHIHSAQSWEQSRNPRELIFNRK